MKTKYLAKYHTLLIAILNFLLPLIIQNTNISILREWQCLYVAAMLLGIDDPDEKTFSIFERDIDEDLKLLDMGERIQAR